MTGGVINWWRWCSIWQVLHSSDCALLILRNRFSHCWSVIQQMHCG
jgi:hypothetical protein